MARKRRKPVAPAGAQAMVIVAGLPKTTHRRSLEIFSQRFPDVIVQGTPASISDGALYPDRYIKRLVHDVGQLILRRRENGPQQPTPAEIHLLFVPSMDQERLLSEFDFFVMPTPLTGLEEWSCRGQQRRHDLDAVATVLADNFQRSAPARTNLNEVRRRLGYLSDNEALLLPPRNYLTPDGELTDVFRALRSGSLKWTDRLKVLGPSNLTHDDVPNRVSKNQTRHPFIDSRDLAFFVAHPTAYDGNVWEADEESPQRDLVLSLKSLYRFGGALPAGFHHDAQKRDGGGLGRATFNCAKRGSIESSDKYANVYPNDVVRVKNATAK